MSTQQIKNQRGFSGLEVILMVALAAVMVGVGVYVYDHRQNAANNSVSSTSNQTSPSASTVKKLDSVKVKSTIESFYSEYLKAAGANTLNPPSLEAEKATIAKYGSNSFQAFYAQSRSYNPVVCGQDTPNGPTTVTNVTADSSSASADVNEDYSGRINKVHVKLDSNYKIDVITCPNL